MDFLRARGRRLDYQNVFGTDAGKRVLTDILSRCDMRTNALTPGQPDVTNFKLGRHDIGNSIISKLHMTNEELHQLKAGGTPYASK